MTNSIQNTATTVPPRFVFSSSYKGHRKGGAEKRLESMGMGGISFSKPLKYALPNLEFPNAVVLNVVVCRNTQMRVKECK